MRKPMAIAGRFAMQAKWTTTFALLAWCISAVVASAIEGEICMPIDSEVRIVNSGSTNTLGFTLTLASDGTAKLEQGDAVQSRKLPETIVTNFFATLRASGPLDALPETPCIKSASFGTTTRIFFNGKPSPDISCPSQNSLVQQLASEASALLDAAGARAVPRHPLAGRPP